LVLHTFDDDDDDDEDDAVAASARVRPLRLLGDASSSYPCFVAREA
jgi:hypothetical protein